MTATLPQSSTSAASRLQAILRSVEALVRAGDMARATRMAAEAVASGHEHANLLVLAAHHHLNRGAANEALACAKRAQEIAPRNTDALNVLGLSLSRLGRFREAVTAYDSALRQMPNVAHLHFNRGRALEDLNDMARARVEYERTLGLEPNHGEALARLATFAALRGDAGAARDYAKRALMQNPHEVMAELALGLADVQERKFESALARVGPLAQKDSASAVNRSIAQGLMGDALDGLDRIAEAFAAYTASKTTLRTAYRNVYEAPGVETARQRLDRLIDYFQAAAAGQWRVGHSGPADSPAESHIFLVGFPRSGTTLLEQLLDSHPDVESMPERDCLIEAATDFILPRDGLSRLAQLDEVELAAYRKRYWKRVGAHGHSARRRVFIDKMPLNSILLCLVAKLFPNAKVLFAIRDPRDVVFSCFRRRFAMSAQMYELLSIDGTAAYYDRVMTLAAIYREKLGLQWHDIRYEDLVCGFESALPKICAFLGLTWSDSVRDFAARAQAKDIDTPSAAQVSRGLYREGVGQWMRYGKHLDPMLPILAPWVGHFGYQEG